MKIHEQVNRLVMRAIALVAAHDDVAQPEVAAELARIRDAAQQAIDRLAAARAQRAEAKAIVSADRIRVREANMAADQEAARLAAQAVKGRA